MALLLGMTRRCSECRVRIVAAATAKAKATLRVCDPECRKRRRARLARRRRRADAEGFRADERKRQRARRQRLRAEMGPMGQPCRGSPAPEEVHYSGSGQATCHELASTRKYRDLQTEVLEIVDRSLRVSRATFQREQARIARELSRLVPSPLVRAGQSPGRVTRHLRHVTNGNGS